MNTSNYSTKPEENGINSPNQKDRKRVKAYKYSNKGRIGIHEAVTIGGRPAFLVYETGKIGALDKIDEPARTVVPPGSAEYPYEPYEFEDIDEVMRYLERAKQESPESLFERAEKIVRKYNDQDDPKLTLIAADIVWSYMQDRFSTTHYLGIIGDNGSGKSTIGDTFEITGYRAVNITDPTAANIFRLLGSVEAGQCTLIADEAEKIDQSTDMMGILKTGTHIKKRVARMTDNNERQQFFYTYCFKIIIAERSPNQRDAKGVLDRTLMMSTYKGNPSFDIKEVLSPAGDPIRQKLLEELLDFRKLMLIYRLVHYNEPIPDIDIGLDGRDKELCKPLLQLYNSNTRTRVKIGSALQHFLDIKNQRKSNLIEAALYPIIVNLCSIYGEELSVARIWEAIQNNIDGTADIYKINEFHTTDYGTLHRNTITNILCDKFGADRKHTNRGSVLTFNPIKLARIGRAYSLQRENRILLAESDPGDSSDGSLDNTNLFGNSAANSSENETEKTSTKANNHMTDLGSTSSKSADSMPVTSSEPSQLSQLSQTFLNRDVFRKYGDTWGCKNCVSTGDVWFMRKHVCRGAEVN